MLTDCGALKTPSLPLTYLLEACSHGWTCWHFQDFFWCRVLLTWGTAELVDDRLAWKLVKGRSSTFTRFRATLFRVGSWLKTKAANFFLHWYSCSLTISWANHADPSSWQEIFVLQIELRNLHFWPSEAIEGDQGVCWPKRTALYCDALPYSYSTV